MSDAYLVGSEVKLRSGREASVVAGHPWLYRGALADELPEQPGLVRVRSARGEELGTAMRGSSGGSLALRMLTRRDEVFNRDLLDERLGAAIALRRRLAVDADACRLVNAEGDGLPGLVVDLYAGTAVLQVFEPEWRAFLDDVAQCVVAHSDATAVVLRRGDSKGEAPTALLGAAPAGPVVIREGAYRLLADLARGQKTGLYLDQRDNRRRLAELSGGATVLNLFSYSCGFAVAALTAGATSVLNVDTSEPAFELGRATYRLNGLDPAADAFVDGDAFQVTRALVAAGRSFDVVVLDPPGFVKRKVDLPRGLAGYRDINVQALRLVAKSGVLMTFSCSAHVEEAEFAGVVQAAAADAGRFATVLERRFAGPDHPVALACPEGRHLKGLLCAVR